MLDLLRFAASVFIVVFHYGDAAPVALDRLHPALSRGYVGTDFFLVLSGYVLSRAYGAAVSAGGVSTPAFFAKRWIRIWPAHILVLAGFVALYTLGELVHLAPHRPDWFRWSDLPTQVFLLQAVGAPGGAGWNLPTWTLSSLLVCYGLFPMIWTAQAKVKSPIAVLGMAVSVVFTAAILAKVALGDTINGAALHFGLMRAFPMFLLGVALARLVLDNTAPSWAVKLIGALGLATLIGAELAAAPHDLITLAAIAALVFAIGSTPIRRSSALVAYGAEMSFSLYLTHTLWGLIWYGAYHAFQTRLHFSPAEQWAYWAAGVVLSVGVAAAFFEGVDKPVQRLLRPWVEAGFRSRRDRYPTPSPNGSTPLPR